VKHSIDRESEIGQNPWFADQSSSGNSDRRVNHLRCCAMEKNHHEGQNRPRSTS
jgi:hypothetical protein